MIRYLFAAVTLGLVSAAMPFSAASRPHRGTDSHNTVVWTNDHLERLHALGLISVVGRVNEEASRSASLSPPYLKTQDARWYAERSARLRDELERRRAQLGGYRQALEDARSLKATTGGINLDGGEMGMTPEAGMEILEQRVSETQIELDALEDLARRNDVPPGALRGR
jgi:hypothetical protein